MKPTIETMVARWEDPAARPLFKGQLIDDDGCCCAQGDVLRLCGWQDDRLRAVGQREADKAVAEELDISMTHSVLLRRQNDKADGCPQNVLARPERILGPRAPEILALWHKFDALDCTAAGAAAWTAARDAAGAAAWAAARDAAGAAAWDAAWATAEVQAGDHLKTAPYFLPLLGIEL